MHQGIGGIDLAREDRLEKADLCVEAFYNLSKSKSFLKTLKRGGDISETGSQL
jgi:hypothetical protein